MSEPNLSNFPDLPDEPEAPKKTTSQRRAAVSPAELAKEKARAQAKAIAGKLGKYFTPVDPIILVVVLALLTTFALPILASSRRASNEAAAIELLRTLPGIQGRFREHGAPDGRHRFATSFFELAAAGLFDGVPQGGTELRRDGFLFHLGTPDDPELHYFAVALPEQWGDSGDHSYYIDDTTKIRVSAGPANGPVFPEVN